ncbi:hypothetical protein Lal_00017231 [Lupinus albus]|uniref:Uncharacterized protein n=1 Tax=Lupinus albus TaxID=3870 RepID=A0A6A4QRD9_LUPAL|nr:hypothetical protein Lalb_Chr04g0262451 [Lupinus albus]KAF1869656.1 hypothetical protein Lal_00017231 [Lupinus albus]
MRRSYILSSHHNPKALHAENENGKMKNFTEKRKTETTTTSSSHKLENEGEIIVIKKLERIPTEDIDAKADAFIKNFKHHLLIQRLQSIENHEQMLARGQ